MLLGSTAEKIFRLSPVPVLTVGPKTPGDAPEHPPQRILYSTGFAAQSLYAGTFALSLAQQNQARLAMLNVIRDLPNDSPQLRAQQEQQNKARLRELIPADAQLAAAPELYVSFGPPADAILQLADEWNPELIVLGVRRPEADARRISWATAYNVVANAPCPVLTVRVPELGN